MKYLRRILNSNIVKKHVSVILLSMVIGGFTAIHLGQDINFDLLNYHYENPHAFITGRVQKDIAVSELESYANPVIDIPGYLAISHLKPRAAAGVLGIIQGLNIWLIYEICLLLFTVFKLKSWWKYVIPLAVAIASFYGAGNVSEIGNTMGDNLASLLIFGALLLLLFSANSALYGVKVKILKATAFLLVGCSIGFKLTSATYGIGLLAAGLIISPGIKRKIYDGFLSLASLVLGVFLTGGFWFAKLYGLFGNPIFPFYNAVFKSPYYTETNFIDSRWQPASAGQSFTRPFEFMHQQSIASELSFRDPRLAIALIAAVVLATYLAYKYVAERKSRVESSPNILVAFVVFFGLSYIVWLEQFAYYRYALPLELLSLVVIGVAIYSLLKIRLAATILLVIVCSYITLQTIPINWGRVPWQPTYFGVQKSDFLNLKDATILVAGYAPFGFIVPYFPESSQTIRIESDLTSPTTGTPAMQKLMRQAVADRQSVGSRFYALQADEEKHKTDKTFERYGYRVTTCKELPVHVRQSIPAKFRLCKLEPIL